MVANEALTFEQLMDECWPAMFEETTDEDVHWLRNVADLLERRTRERATQVRENEPERRN